MRDELMALAEKEEAILEALTDAYNARKLEYLHFSPAYDVTAARAAALRARAGEG